jgi:ribosomal protein L37AE/L43A
MAMPTFFVQECPTCGRNLEIRVEYLGRIVSCRHCRGQFTASDPNSNSSGMRGAADAILRRAEELLALAEKRRLSRQYQF